MSVIGIVGLGVVGSACKFGFEVLNHAVLVHDIKLATKIEDVLPSEVCFITVPTPAKDDGECDISVVDSVVSSLVERKYKGIIVIKSTVPPGTTDLLAEKYPIIHFDYVNIPTKFVFCPEFLKERSSLIDFTERHDLLVIGTKDAKVFNIIKDLHGHFPKKVIQLAPKEAEMCKYFNNIYNATLITFANSFYQLCARSKIDYSKVKNAMVLRDHISREYLECNEKWQGFSGPCLVKDTKAIAHLMRQSTVRFFDMLLSENEKHPATVPDGMRKDV